MICKSPEVCRLTLKCFGLEKKRILLNRPRCKPESPATVSWNQLTLRPTYHPLNRISVGTDQRCRAEEGGFILTPTAAQL